MEREPALWASGGLGYMELMPGCSECQGQQGSPLLLLQPPALPRSVPPQVLLEAYMATDTCAQRRAESSPAMLAQ